MTLGARLLVVEDDPAIRRLVRIALERAGHHVTDAATARDALALIEIVRPEIVLLDLGLPDRDGIELIQPLRARCDATLIVLSAREAIEEKVVALDLGADDYLTKPFDTEELLARIRTALRHRAAGDGADGEGWEAGGVHADLVHRRVTRHGEPVHLTPKEYGVLAELSRHPDRVVSHRQLLRTVWGPAHEQRVEYLRIVMRGLRQKLETDPAAPTLLLTELGVGYRINL